MLLLAGSELLKKTLFHNDPNEPQTHYAAPFFTPMEKRRNMLTSSEPRNEKITRLGNIESKSLLANCVEKQEQSMICWPSASGQKQPRPWRLRSVLRVVGGSKKSKFKFNHVRTELLLGNHKLVNCIFTSSLKVLSVYWKLLTLTNPMSEICGVPQILLLKTKTICLKDMNNLVEEHSSGWRTWITILVWNSSPKQLSAIRVLAVCIEGPMVLGLSRAAKWRRPFADTYMTWRRLPSKTHREMRKKTWTWDFGWHVLQFIIQDELRWSRMMADDTSWSQTTPGEPGWAQKMIPDETDEPTWSQIS